jgi:hypothetical protein
MASDSEWRELGLLPGVGDPDDLHEAFCVEPVVEPIDDFVFVPAPEMDELLSAALTRDGTQIDFGIGIDPSEWTVSIATNVGSETQLRNGSYAELSIRNQRVRIVNTTTRASDRTSTGALVLDAGSRNLFDVELEQELLVTTQPDGSRWVDLTELRLVDGTGITLGAHEGGFDEAAPPGSCVEEAAIGFGPVPWNMPTVHLPDFSSCNYSQCVSMAEGWIRAHHHAWRINQMMELLADQPSTFRSFLWGQPGLDANHVAVGSSGSATSPKHYFGPYNDDRFDAIKEAVELMWLTIFHGWTSGHEIELHCKDCGGWYGAHPTVGNVHVCEDAFEDADDHFPVEQDAVTHTLLHEVMHHQFVHYEGLTMLVDIMTHGHGSACVSDLQTEYHVGIDEIRHLASYVAADGEGCWHRDKALRAVDAYALFAMTIGERVRDGHLAYWPKYADPTPHPPECQGAPGCLCDPIPFNAAIGPDGDGGPDLYCEDNEGETTCQLTAVNAGEIVGICVLCDDVRGGGCPCDDSMPCDVGQCWGDDTQNGGIGRCYEDPPPAWQCLADCQALYNDEQATCQHDHLGGARCVDSSCPPWTTDECYGQNLVCFDGECVQECNYYEHPDYEHVVTCQDAGYPPAFECVGYRCEVP